MLINQDKFRVCGYKVPQYFWFALSGALCDIVQAFVDYGIYLIYPFEFEKTTVCWTTSYTASVFIRHFSHRLLVFGEYEGSYCASLTRTYLTYASSIVMSMVSNHFIVSFLQLDHVHAWVITMLWTGIYNYFMLKASWKKPSPPATTSTAVNDSKQQQQQQQQEEDLEAMDPLLAKHKI